MELDSKESNRMGFPIKKRTAQGWLLRIEAAKEWVDEKRHLQYEGVVVSIPRDMEAEIPITFSTLSLEQMNYETYRLLLHAHSRFAHDYEVYPDGFESDDSPTYVDGGGDVYIRILLSKDLLKKITGLSSRQIEDAFGPISIRNTKELLDRIPRTVEILKDKVVIVKAA